jgi:hypothetical protein
MLPLAPAEATNLLAGRATTLPNPSPIVMKDAGKHRRHLIFVWSVPFLKAHDLASLCGTSRDICALVRADLFRRVVLKTDAAAAAFCRTIQEDALIPASAHQEESEASSTPCANGLTEVKVLGWHVRTLVFSFKLDCELPPRFCSFVLMNIIYPYFSCENLGYIHREFPQSSTVSTETLHTTVAVEFHTGLRRYLEGLAQTLSRPDDSGYGKCERSDGRFTREYDKICLHRFETNVIAHEVLST